VRKTFRPPFSTVTSTWRFSLVSPPLPLAVPRTVYPPGTDINIVTLAAPSRRVDSVGLDDISPRTAFPDVVHDTVLQADAPG